MTRRAALCVWKHFALFYFRHPFGCPMLLFLFLRLIRSCASLPISRSRPLARLRHCASRLDFAKSLQFGKMTHTRARENSTALIPRWRMKCTMHIQGVHTYQKKKKYQDRRVVESPHYTIAALMKNGKGKTKSLHRSISAKKIPRRGMPEKECQRYT